MAHGMVLRDRRSDRKPRSVAGAWRAFLVVFMIWSAIPLVFWLLGADFTAAEGAWGRKDACGPVRMLPGLGEIPCAWARVGIFYVVPFAAFLYALKPMILQD